MSGCDVCQVPTKGHTAGFTPPSRCRGESVRKEESPEMQSMFCVGIISIQRLSARCAPTYSLSGV